MLISEEKYQDGLKMIKNIIRYLFMLIPNYIKSLKNEFDLHYPPPYTDEEFEADINERVRRLVEQRLGSSYITEEDVKKQKEKVLKIKF
jgi:hypothetical protein